jgi:hypothetical protein
MALILPLMKWEDVMSALVRFAAAAMLMFGHASHVQAEPQHCADSPAWGSSRIGQAISALSPADGISNAYVGTAVAQPSPVERNAGNRRPGGRLAGTGGEVGRTHAHTPLLRLFVVAYLSGPPGSPN